MRRHGNALLYIQEAILLAGAVFSLMVAGISARFITMSPDWPFSWFAFFPLIAGLILLSNTHFLSQILLRIPTFATKAETEHRLPFYVGDVIRPDGTQKRLAEDLWLAGMKCRDYFRGIALDRLESARAQGRQQAIMILVAGVAFYLADSPPLDLPSLAMLLANLAL